MIEQDFEALNNNYSKMQSVVEIAALPQSAVNKLLHLVMEENNIRINEATALLQVNKDFAAIRSFYCKRFYSASSVEKPDILARYQSLYDILNRVSNGDLSKEHASKMIKVATSDWENEIIWDNILRFFVAMSCAIPLAAGVVILPFVLPVISLNLYIGAAILTAASSSIILALSQCYNNFSNIESTEPVRKNSRIELSFLSSMNNVRPEKSQLKTNEPLEDADDYAASHQIPSVI